MESTRVGHRIINQEYLFLILAIWWNTFQVRQCQCPPSLTTFEKVSGKSLKTSGANLMYLYKGTPGEASVTRECLSRCQKSPDCNSMLLSYTGNMCMKSTVTSEGHRAEFADSSPPAATSYFEKICINAPLCSRLWSFERVIGYELSGFDDKTILDVPSRLACEERCLTERRFVCRSGEYDYTSRQCKLSIEDRRSQPSSFRAAYDNIDYFENQCVSESSPDWTGCDYEESPDTDLERPDAIMSAGTKAQCQTLCDSSQSFLCRAYSFWGSNGQCLLSSDDAYNLPASVVTRKRIGTSYYQRANCLDLKLTCTRTEMHLILRTRQRFDGRIYSQSDPHSCQTYGEQKFVTKFTMDVRGQCGVTMQDDDHLTNTVVIQYHPLIQQKGDRVIKLYCSLFEDFNKTISTQFGVIQGPDPVVTSVVNATAPTPSIRLRITDANGTEVTDTVRIGDHLYFRIEIDEDSVFGIFARNMTAKNNRGDVMIPLIDEYGCPYNSGIFPGFEKIPNSKSLQSKFRAFKFSEDAVVRFTVNVHFCLEECNSVVCSNNVPAYGRRRRQVETEEEEEESIVPDYPLVAAIFVEGANSFCGNSSWPPVDNSRYIDERETEMSDELVCTTKTVVVVSSLGALFLQIGLLAACGTCLLLSRKHQRPRYSEDAASTITETLPPFSTDMHRHSRLR